MAGPVQKQSTQEQRQPATPVRVANNYNWFTKGDEVFPSMLKAIDAAQKSVCLETYIYSAEHPGDSFRDAMVRACRRGVTVRVLVDALGSFNLSDAFWNPLRECGGEVRIFNPIAVNRLGLRNHRKLLVCDNHVAFVGGYNIAPEYTGDGVSCGWCDLGLRIEGPLASQLAHSFELMFRRAAFRQKRFARLRRAETRMVLGSGDEQILLSGPGRGRSPFRQALKGDLGKARSVQMMVAYFLPSWQTRRQLARVVRRGGRVELILASKSDVSVSLLAARSLYRRFLRAGVEIYEYQPQILHAKLLVIDDAVYVGSSNLDPRSMNINYEIMIRFENDQIAAQAREVFARAQKHCKKIELADWRGSRPLLERIKQRWAYFLLVKVDPYIARRQWLALPD